MVRTWIHIFAAFLCIIAAACSDDVAEPQDDGPSGSIEIIKITESSSSESVFNSFFRPSIVPIHFSNQIEIAISSSSKTRYSSSKNKVSSSSSIPAISSSIKSSSSVATSSSNTPKSSAALHFYECDKYDCVTTEFLNPDVSYGEFLDERDNQVYRTIVITNHVWTAQNMNYNAGSNSEAASWCYDNDPENCRKYGRLYTWDAAQEACPKGWHLPTHDEWIELLDDHACDEELLDDGTWAFDCSANQLKSAESWNEDVENAHGFSATAAGINFNGAFISAGEMAFFWSLTDTLSLYAFATMLQDNVKYALFGATDKNYGFSVRCVKGEAE